MKLHKHILAALVLLLLMIALPATVLAQTDIIYTFNGNAERYGPGSELYMLGYVGDTNVGLPLADTEASIRILDQSNREIHYAVRTTDSKGLFNTRLSVPSGVTGAMTVQITAAGKTVSETLTMPGTTDKITVRGFVDSVGYLPGESVRTTPADTSRLGILFTGNVNNYNNRGAQLLIDITGSTLLSVNERNRDCFTLYKRDASGSFSRIASRVDLINSRDTAIDYPIPESAVTPLIAGASVGSNNRRNVAYVTPDEGVQPDTTYRLVIDRRLSINDSSVLGEDLTLYFTTASLSAGTGTGSSTDLVTSPGSTVNIPVTTDAGTGEVTAALDAQTTQILISDALVPLAQGGAAALPVTLDFSGITGATSAILPKEALAQIVQASLRLQVLLPLGSVSLDAGALASAVTQADGASISVGLTLMNTADMSEAQRDAIRDGDLVFSITMASGDLPIREFNGTISVTVPYDGPLPIAVWYLNASGQTQMLDHCVYDPGTGYITFTTNHLSLYVAGHFDDGVTRLRLSIGEIGFTVNNVLAVMDVMPMIVGDRTMVPLRFISEALGADVHWDDETRTASVELDGATAAVTIDEIAPGMDVPAIIVNSRTMVPLRFISESLGCDVLWVPGALRIDITR